MAKKPIYRCSVNPYHLTARSNNKEWFYLPLDEVWEVMSDQLYATSVAYSLRIHAFVLMSNHFHLVASTPDKNVDSAMNYFIREVSRKLNTRSERINHNFGGNYKRCLIQSPIYYSHVIKYVYLNPVKADVCAHADEYPFSTLAGLLGNTNLRFPLFAPHPTHRVGIPAEPDGLSYLLRHTMFDTADNDAIRRGLKRRIFEVSVKGRRKLGV